ncbi:MYND-type domain-containing protein [Mycena kentingensis (nom. inval.)]|nr:MYND-type domain-containing protein [Mycena kentingensis (nom. inval.)]
MHPALNRSQIAKIPLAYRRVAYALFDRSSRDPRADIVQFFSVLATAAFTGLNPPWLKYLLPVVYSGLHTDDMTYLEQTRLDALPYDAVIIIVTRILVSLQTLNYIAGATGSSGNLPAGAIPDLWERLWPWIRFLDLHQDQLCGLRDLQTYTPNSSANLLVFRLVFGNADREMQMRMLQADGLYGFIGRSWRHVLEEREMVLLESTGGILDNILRALPGNRIPDNDWDELVSALGGTMDGLAQCVVRQLDLVYPRQRTGPIPTTDLMLGRILSVRLVLIRTFGVLHDVKRRPMVEFTDAFAIHGGFATLTRAMRSIALAAPTTLRNHYLIDFLGIFSHLFTIVISPRYMAEAIQAGFLHVLVLGGAASRRDPELYQDVQDSIERDLYLYTVFYPVARSLRPGLAAIPVEDEARLSPALANVWQTWKREVRMRTDLAERLADGRESVPLVCQNPPCLKPRATQDAAFRQCGGCGIKVYCSKACQRSHYYEFDHRNLCKGDTKRRLEGKLSKKDWRLIQLICNAEFRELQDDICVMTLQRLHQNPAVENPYPVAIIDFQQRALRCQITPVLAEQINTSGTPDFHRRYSERAHAHMIRFGAGALDFQIRMTWVSTGRGLVRAMRDLAAKLPDYVVDYGAYRFDIALAMAAEDVQTHC